MVPRVYSKVKALLWVQLLIQAINSPDTCARCGGSPIVLIGTANSFFDQGGIMFLFYMGLPHM